MKRLLTLTLILLTALSAQAQTTRPAVFRQPADSAAKWVGRGVAVAICYEPNSGTVSLANWEKAWVAAGAKVIREPSGNLAADDSDPNLIGILCPIQEPDNTAVGVHDAAVYNHQDPAPSVEALYASVETSCRTIRAGAPHKPIYLVVGLEQLRWNKADYARLAAAADYVIVDWYAIHRGLTPADLAGVLDKARAVMGAKLAYVCVECSLQYLDPNSYPKQRCPTVAEFQAEWTGIAARGLGGCLFPQQIGDAGTNKPFLYDAMPAELVTAFMALSRPIYVPPAKAIVRVITITIYGDGSSDVASK